MDIPHHVVSDDRWYATWFLTVEELWPCEVKIPKEWLRHPLLVTSQLMKG
jgi:hypothetical protein